MASSSSLEALFLRARDGELAAGRWSAATVALLLAFHVTFVTPFVAAAALRQAASAAHQGLVRVAAGLAELEPRIGGASAAVDEVMLPALDRLAGELAGDVARLAATRRSLADLVAAQTADGGAGPEGAEDELAGVEPFQVENIDRILAIGEAATRDELLAALAPLVEERVTHPRFSGLQELWTSSVVPRIETDLDAVAGRVPELRSAFDTAVPDAEGGGEAPWQTFAAALAAERRAVRDLVWAPPERSDWWASGDAREGELLAFALDPAVAEQLRRPLALDQFRVTAEATETAYRQLVAAVERRAEIAREAGSGAVPALAAGGFELMEIVRVFPLVLALALALLFTVAARRRRELGLLTQALIEGGVRPLADWYFLRPRWGLGGGPPRRERARAWRATWLRILALALPALAWIGLAAVQLRSLEPPGRLATATAAGTLAFLLAVAYHFAIARSLHRLLAASAVSPAANDGDAEQEEDDLLDGHPLRR